MNPQTREQKLTRLAELIHDQTLGRYNARYPGVDHERDARVTIKVGPVWTKVDVGSSGKYVVDKAGNVYGIKAYGVPHRGHQYGTLDTVDDWYWGEYRAVSLSQRPTVSLVQSKAGELRTRKGSEKCQPNT